MMRRLVCERNVSISKDRMPLPGDEVLYVAYPPSMPDRAWVHFTNGKFVEVPIWVEDRDPVTGLIPVRPPDPNIPKKEQ